MALTYLTATVADNMLANITTTGLFMSIHSASPSNTGANELVAGTAYTAVSGGRPPIAWATSSGGIPYFGLWTANTGGTFLFGGPTSGLSGSIASGGNVVFASATTLTQS